MANYRRMMDRWRSWRLDEEIENETSVPFEVIGKNSIMVKGRKLSAKLVFSGNDLKDIVEGKKKKGKVVLASLKIK
jgi:hypothetical protein|tara:strand:+ start:188 stop:415 length:228 start_codon:yes stop_codon:yes gene_type:complete